MSVLVRIPTPLRSLTEGHADVDASGTNVATCISDLEADQQSTLKLERATGDQLAHISSFDILHGDEVNSFNFIEIINSANVWVVQ